MNHIMNFNYIVICPIICFADHSEVPHWQIQIPYNNVAHMYHSMYRRMYIPFESTNRTAGERIMKLMEKLHEGVKELHHLTDVTPEQEFHKKYLQPVRFMVMRGRKQWNMISWRNTELAEKYGWDEEEIESFRVMYREIMDLVNEMEEFLKVRNVDLSDN